MQEQIEELQARVAFHEDTIQEMTAALVDQQKALHELREMVKHLNKQMKVMATSPLVNSDEETPPPHY